MVTTHLLRALEGVADGASVETHRMLAARARLVMAESVTTLLLEPDRQLVSS